MSFSGVRNKKGAARGSLIKPRSYDFRNSNNSAGFEGRHFFSETG